MVNIFWDIEADGLLHDWEPEAATGIGCCVALFERGNSLWWDTDWQGGDVRNYLGEPETDKVYVIGHNIFDYDLPMMAKHKGWEYDILPDRLNGREVQFVDTMILSKLLNPDRAMPEGFTDQWKPKFVGHSLPGPHSLEVWAYRLNMTKPALVYGDNMGNVPHEILVAQAKADVEITRELYYALMQEARELNLKLHKPLKCEQAVRHIITQGAMHGVCFDKALAEKCIPDLDQKMAELAAKVEPLLPVRELPKSRLKFPPKVRFKKDGSPSAHAIKYFGEALEQNPLGTWIVYLGGDDAIPLADWPADKAFGVTTEPMTIANQAEIKQWLITEHGWKPTIWNKDKEGNHTSPKFHQNGKLCENLERLAEFVPVVKDIVLWLSYRNRRNVIKSENGTGWLHHPRLAIDGRLPADADTMGTGTFRFTHRVVANVPRPSSTYGEEMRSLFCASPGKVLVGWDASQLEDRCKAHYTYTCEGGKEYADKILDPNFDVHTENAENWSMERQATKNGHYALQYNCQPPKLAETLGVDIDTATKYHEDWWSRNEPLRELTFKVEEIWEFQYNKQWLPGIDGRLVPTRKKHALVNTLLQSSGVIVMKYAMVWWWNEIRKRGIPAVQVIHYHDEAVAECPPEWADVVGPLGVESIQKAGEMLGFRVPLTSSYKVGQSWKDIH